MVWSSWAAQRTCTARSPPPGHSPYTAREIPPGTHDRMRHLRNLAILTVLSAFWPAWGSSPSVAELLACTQVADATARLSCFDQRAAALSAAGPVAAIPAPAKKLTPEQKIGLTRDKVDALET